MSYVVFARRFRPQNFDQIIGQEHVSRTLKNAIAENRVAHAYLFSGPRGVGKTTTARILAKALNCKDLQGADPCGKCPNCLEITSGSSVDVQEIDGASNRGIDEIRSLRDNVKFAPASSKHKIYIIDEAHQITDAAFNALLKTLEEPPEHVVFILATTESQKIPVTILSRCQRYRFRLLSSQEIMSTLEMIVKADKLRIETDALRVITAAAGGSLRDSLSLLDQAVSFTSGKVTYADMQNLLGFLPQETVHQAARSLAERDLSGILALVKTITDQGYSPLQFARDLREHLRKVMLHGINPAVLEISDEDKKVLEAQNPLFSTAWLIRSGHLLSRAHDEMRWSEQPRLILELYMLKLAQPYAGIDELVARLEKLEKSTPRGDYSCAEPPSPPPPPPAPAKSSRPQASAPALEPEPCTGPVQPEPKTTPQPEPPAAQPSGDPQTLWKRVIAAFQDARPLAASALIGSRVKEVSGNVLMLSVANKFQSEGVERNRTDIEELVVKHFGRLLGVRTVIEERAPEQSAAPESSEIIVEQEEKDAAAAPREYFQVAGDLTGHQDTLPHGMDKILGKFPGRVIKKQKPDQQQ